MLQGSLGQSLAQFLTPEKETDSDPELRAERQRCRDDFIHFVVNYCWILDASNPNNPHWLRFELWEGQKELARFIHENRQTIVLKARQLGISWLALAYCLWLMIFKPNSQVGIWSRGQAEANYLLGQDRLKGMYAHIPEWMRVHKVMLDNEDTWRLSNGSTARAFPPNKGNSFTHTFAFMDEADLVDDQRRLMGSVKPSIDGGGKILQVSTSNARTPESDFKRTFVNAESGQSPWKSFFLPWYTRPERNLEWYEDKKTEIMFRTGSLDELYEAYPATAAEAMSGLTQHKLIPPAWVFQCWQEQAPLLDYRNVTPDDVPATDALSRIPYIPGLIVYEFPKPGFEYLGGADCAQGNWNSDPSSTHFINRWTGEEVARFSGQHTPEVHAHYTCLLSDFYNRAMFLPERNNHGAAFILECQNLGYISRVLTGFDKGLGWNNSVAGKTFMYDAAVPSFQWKDCIIHSFSTYTEITSIEVETRKAPVGRHDDEAISYVLALVARTRFMPHINPVTEDTREEEYNLRDSSYRY